jgi:hypothetical protein
MIETSGDCTTIPLHLYTTKTKLSAFIKLTELGAHMLPSYALMMDILAPSAVKPLSPPLYDSLQVFSGVFLLVTVFASVSLAWRK